MGWVGIHQGFKKVLRRTYIHVMMDDDENPSNDKLTYKAYVYIKSSHKCFI